MLDDGIQGRELSLEQLPQPLRGMFELLETQRDHPAHVWFEKIGNGIFEDDHAVSGLPGPHMMYRFRRASRVAYIWQTAREWVVRPWRGMRGRVSNEMVCVANFAAALDYLLTQPGSSDQ